MTHCRLCASPCVYEVEPAFGEHLPAVMEADVWRVVAGNNLILEVCQLCWQLWPNDWKLFPAEGFGGSADTHRSSHIALDALLELLAPA